MQQSCIYDEQVFFDTNGITHFCPCKLFFFFPFGAIDVYGPNKFYVTLRKFLL